MSSSKILDVLFCRVVDLKDINLYFSESASQHSKYTPELARFCDDEARQRCQKSIKNFVKGQR